VDSRTAARVVRSVEIVSVEILPAKAGFVLYWEKLN